MSEEQVPFHKRFATKIIEAMRSGTAPWQQPWKPGQNMLPHNGLTGRSYRGANALALLLEARSDPRWYTFNQAKSLDCSVKKGEKGQTVIYWKFEDERVERDAAGKIIRGDDGNPRMVREPLLRPRAFFATVFNASQIEGLPPLVINQPAWEPLDKASTLMSKAEVAHDQRDKAFYRPSTDKIHLPPMEQFPTAEDYYGTALHELAHWTGHPGRLNRSDKGPFGSPEYAREELRAEIGSMMLCAEVGLAFEPRQESVAYIASWIRALEQDPNEIFRAAADSEKIRDFVLSLDLEQTKDAVVEAAVNSPTAEPTMQQTPDRIYLDVPYEERAVAKAGGAKYDSKQRTWYVTSEAAATALPQFPITTPSIQDQPNLDRIYLAVPYKDREIAKAAGAKYDKAQKLWYVTDEDAAKQLSQFRPKGIDAPSLSPREEFAGVLTKLGFVLGDEHPVFDGKPHRIAVKGDKVGEVAGFYVAYGDGTPAGYAKNNRTGEEERWKAKGYVLTPDQAADLKASAAQKIQERESEIAATHERVADKIAERVKSATQAASTPYTMAKGLSGATKGVYADVYNETLMVPAYDAKGKLWTAQYISPDGTKRFEKGSHKSGAFHVIGGFDHLATAKAVMISEGYATAASIAEVVPPATAVVAAFDAGNLKAVAQSISQTFPTARLIIAGDDDRGNPANPGVKFATQAATEVGAIVVFPRFSTQDPATLSDFNDLANSSLGKLGLQDQISQALTAQLQKSAVPSVKVQRDLPLEASR